MGCTASVQVMPYSTVPVPKTASTTTYGPKSASTIYGPRSASTVRGPQSASTIHGPQSAVSQLRVPGTVETQDTNQVSESNNITNENQTKMTGSNGLVIISENKTGDSRLDEVRI